MKAKDTSHIRMIVGAVCLSIVFIVYTWASVQQTTVEGALDALNERSTACAYVTNHKLFI